jgi:hypothetical protein
MSNTIYIGAYIEVVKMPSIIEDVEDEQFEYPNCSKKCDHSFLTRKAKYCPSCGKPINLNVKKIQVPHAWDMADVSEFLDGDDLEWANGWNMDNRDVDRILVPAYSGKWGQRRDVDYDGYVGKIIKAPTHSYSTALAKKWAKTLKKMDLQGIEYRIKEGMVLFYIQD